MDTYDIIKQLTAKTDMISGESLKDNFKALLPVVAVHQGGTHIYTGVCVLKFSEQIKEPHN